MDVTLWWARGPYVGPRPSLSQVQFRVHSLSWLHWWMWLYDGPWALRWALGPIIPRCNLGFMPSPDCIDGCDFMMGPGPLGGPWAQQSRPTVPLGPSGSKRSKLGRWTKWSKLIRGPSGPSGRTISGPPSRHAVYIYIYDFYSHVDICADVFVFGCPTATPPKCMELSMWTNIWAKINLRITRRQAKIDWTSKEVIPKPNISGFFGGDWEPSGPHTVPGVYKRMPGKRIWKSTKNRSTSGLKFRVFYIVFHMPMVAKSMQ